MKLTEKNIMGDKNTHGIHSEDLVLMGPDACEVMVDAIEDSLESMQPNDSHHITTIKVDGAPAAVCASDFKGACFVATKGAFNVDPIIARTPEECDEIWGDRPDLAAKLKTLLKWLPMLKIPKDQMWQGDFLFTHNDLEVQELDGEKCVTFQPNTIVYAVPLTDPNATKITRAEAGIVWHTRYSYDADGNRRKSFDIKANELQDVPAVFSIDATIPNYSGKVNLSQEDAIEAERHLNEVKRLLPQLLDDPNYPAIIEKKVKALLDRYKNIMVRKNKQYLTEEDFGGIEQLLRDNFQKKITDKPYSTEKGLEKGKANLEAEITRINTYKPTILMAWLIQNHVAEIKEIFIKKLNDMTIMRSYLMKKNGQLSRTGGEGFVVSDIDGNAQKWVSRLEFSKANFSGDFVKGWNSDKRTKQELEEAYKVKLGKFIEDMMGEIQDVLNPIIDEVQVTNKKDVKKRTSPKGAEYVLMPIDGEDRNDKAVAVLNKMEDKPEVFENPTLIKGGSGFRTPIINTSIETSTGQDASIILNFKPKSGAERADSMSTKADEIYWAQCMSWYNCGDFNNFPNDDTDFDEIDLTQFGLNSDLHPKNSNRIGYTEGTKMLLNSKYFDKEEYYFSREEITFDRGIPTRIKSPHSLIIETAKKVMRGFNQKDDWNPADIYACKKSYYNTFVKEWEKLTEDSTGENLNTQDGAMGFSKINKYLMDQLNNRNLIGVSLKDTYAPKLEEQNFDNNLNLRIMKSNYEHCSLTAVRAPALLLKSEALSKYPTVKDGSRLLNGMIMGVALYAIDNDSNTPLNIYYRSFGDNNLYVDAGKDGTSARLGKMPKFLFNNLLIDATKNTSIPLDGEKIKATVIKEMLGDDSDIIRKIKVIEKGPIPISYPENSSEYAITVSNWMLFKKRILMNKTIVDNFALPATRMEQGISPKTQADILTLYIWPKVIDFLYMLEANSNNMEFILKTLLQGSAKTYPGCAPFIKIY